MINIKFTYKKFFYWTFVALVGSMYVISLSNMPNEWFRDRDNYLIYANYPESIIDLYENKFILIVNEPFFLYSNIWLGKIFENDFIPNFFVYFITTVFIFFIGYNAKSTIGFIFGLVLSILIPYILQAELVALRQGLATALFIPFFFLVKDDKKILVILLVCAFFHSIFFLFFLFYFLNFFVLSRFSIRKKLIINSVFMMILSLIGIVVAKYLGLRQGSEYMGVEGDVGGGAFLLFAFVFVYVYAYGNKDNKRLYEFVMIGLTIFLTSYFLSPVSGRLFNTVAPFLVFLLVSKNRTIDYIFISFLSVVFLALFLSGSYYELLAVSELLIPEYFMKYLQSLFSL
ncbi:EpsG family protein [Psychrobacter sp. DAB_AL43B]|uniref:EpsG family protein n=1 Tax=Psychrobacter sp. DAB_AL43B TaxID=1028416 RepID=UPI0015521997|nr:EpsG family protein [Psychrobacter sp. DAB_AL43B]